MNNYNKKIIAKYLKLGEDAVKKYEYSSGIIYFDEVLKTDLKNSEAYFKRGICKYYIQTKGGNKLVGVIEDFNKAAELDPKNCEISYWQGRANYYMYDIKEALENHQQSIKLNPNFADSYFEIAGIYDDVKGYENKSK